MAKKVITVDDSATVRLALKGPLLKDGDDVIEANDGVDAVDILKNENVDLMITDLNMPSMDGIELIRRIRRDGKYRFLPIIMLTTETDDEKKMEGRAAGASGWIMKPFTPHQLLAVVKMVCSC